jgi:hypothetical protein
MKRPAAVIAERDSKLTDFDPGSRSGCAAQGRIDLNEE